MPSGFIKKVSVIAWVLLLAGCRGSAKRAPALGEAYVGPATLNLRSDIPTQSATVVTVKHGDRLEILLQHRSFLRVRAPNGAEGWTDQRQLLGADDMTALKALAQRAASMPSQGRATTDADLRVHIQPATLSPSFLIIKANEKVDVVTHIRRTRKDLPRKPLVVPAKRTKAGKKPSKAPPYPPPPMPAPPPLPADWLDLSKTDLPDDEAEAEARNTPPEATDDWSLVRALDGQTGWVLTRRLRPAIPDEVYQYAEGHRVVSYFSLGTVRDGDLQKDIWLWTTVEEGVRPYDFDSFRVFVWSAHRHRYETAYIERNLIGYAPVLIQPVHLSTGKGKSQSAGEEFTGFSVCVEKKDGQRYRRQYALMNTLVRFAGEQPCQVPPPMEFGSTAALPLTLTQATQPPPRASVWQRARKRLRGWFGQ